MRITGSLGGLRPGGPRVRGRWRPHMGQKLRGRCGGLEPSDLILAQLDERGVDVLV